MADESDRRRRVQEMPAAVLPLWVCRTFVHDACCMLVEQPDCLFLSHCKWSPSCTVAFAHSVELNLHPILHILHLTALLPMPNRFTRCKIIQCSSDNQSNSATTNLKAV
jgi:hypothetical protein